MPKKKPARRGRPPLPDAERRSAVIILRCTPAERVSLQAAAKKAGLTLTAYLLRSRNSP